MAGSGHLALADMGLSYPQDRLLSEAPVICGTPAYMAPEQVRCGGDGALSEEIQKTVDWWALGLVLYEMNTGHHPFHSDDDLRANFVKILKCEVDYRGVNEALAALVQALLHTDYRRRLGAGSDGTNNVKAHAAFNARRNSNSNSTTANGGTGSGTGSGGGSGDHGGARVRRGGTGGTGASGTMMTMTRGGPLGLGGAAADAADGGGKGVQIDWIALEAGRMKPPLQPAEQRGGSSIVDTSDVSIAYGRDPLSRTNTAAHKEADDFEVRAYVFVCVYVCVCVWVLGMHGGAFACVEEFVDTRSL